MPAQTRLTMFLVIGMPVFGIFGAFPYYLPELFPTRVRATGARVELLTVRPDRTSVWAQYTVLVADRDRVQERMKQAGIPTAVHYPKPLHLQSAYQKLCDPSPMPVSEALAARVISLPMSADLSDAQIDQVVAALARATTN
jgi:UDP-2-acetamido-2-deoxy-ribo-hexuluronate aminotransferase